MKAARKERRRRGDRSTWERQEQMRAMMTERGYGGCLLQEAKGKETGRKSSRWEVYRRSEEKVAGGGG